MAATLRFMLYLLLCSLLTFHMSNLVAQDYPSKPVSYIVPNAPGTTSDLVARIMALEMSKLLGQQIIVENKPGASGIIGYEYVAKQMPADGYTIAFAFVPDLATLPLVAKGLRFDSLKDLPPVITLAEAKLVLGSPIKSPWRTFGEFVTYAKNNPGKLNYGSSSGLTRLPMLVFIQDLRLDIVHIPYSSGGPFIQALAAGQIHLGWISESTVSASGDKYQVLGVTGEQRSTLLPNVPTLGELGYPQIRGLSISLNVRAGTPQSAIEMLHTSAFRTLQQSAVKAQLEKIRFVPVGDTTAAAARRLLDDAKLFAGIAARAGIVPE